MITIQLDISLSSVESKDRIYVKTHAERCYGDLFSWKIKDNKLIGTLQCHDESILSDYVGIIKIVKQEVSKHAERLAIL